MTTITTQQARQRFRVLPNDLQDVIFSVQTAEIIRRTAEENHLTTDKIPPVAESVGLVFLGFIHPEDLIKEIQDRLGIAQQAAAAIANSLNSKLFQPIKTTIEKIYAPAPLEPTHLPPEPPRIIEEVKKPFSSAGPTEPAKPIAPAPPTPTPLGKPSPLPSISQPPAPATPKPTIQPSAPIPAPPTPPVFIHKEAEAKQIAPKPGFHIEIPIPKPPATPKPASPEPAKIEIGPSLYGKPPSATQPIKPLIGRTEVPIPRVIHYSQWKTSLEKPPGKPEPVSLSQLSAISIPKPPPTTGKTEPPAASRIEPSLTPRVEPMPPIGIPPIPPQKQPVPASSSSSAGSPGLTQTKPPIPATQPSRPTEPAELAEPYKPVIPSFPPAVSPSTQLGASRVEPPMPKPPTPSAPNP